MAGKFALAAASLEDRKN